MTNTCKYYKTLFSIIDRTSCLFGNPVIDIHYAQGIESSYGCWYNVLFLLVLVLQWPVLFDNYRPIYIGKNQNPKNMFFCCTVYTARKTHIFSVFGQEKRMRKKTRISYCFFGKWCACANSVYL